MQASTRTSTAKKVSKSINQWMKTSLKSSLKTTQRILVRKPKYLAHRGFIGSTQIDVANYIFSQKTGAGYAHSAELVDAILGKPVQEHYATSQRLTRFLKKRDLTFQKTDKDGHYKIFTVPVTTSVVPLPKSTFNAVESAAQVLMVSLRKVLQDIYGSPSIQESQFVQSLPEKIKKVFLEATEHSPHYIPQLHHENMKEYPFLDNVGLDLVLIQEYMQLRGKKLSKLIEEGDESQIPELPFRILELNAGSPSGASNNQNVLEGLSQEDPQLLESLGKVFPNDHFKVLGETYKSLGESWTGRKDGVQVLLPPGGANGAAPEIHQLAAYSGLIYTDAGQLYCDSLGWIRLRTVKGQDPVVTAIYSRVNSDSALFSKEKGIYLRDPEDGEPIYCVDVLKPWKKSKPEIIKDAEGKPIPLESDYEIPSAAEAIVNRKLYMGGLNRLLDNKIILATLTEYAPRYFEKDLIKMGLDVLGARVSPPECLPSEKASVDIIKNNPQDWVVKAPNLSGGTGVHILMTLNAKKQKEVIEAAQKTPDQFAYQKVVKIGRIPVASKSAGKFRFENLAADIRMWVFYGGHETLPKLTHNALVRFAPQEKGPMSSIVNTSKGGGYAPFVVVDDMDSSESISALELAQPKEPVPFSCELPAFVGAQLVQVSLMIQELRGLFHQESVDAYQVSGLLYALKLQLREITSYVHPRCMEAVYSMIEVVENRIDEKAIASYFLKLNSLQAQMVSDLQKLDSVLSPDFYTVLDQLNCLDQDFMNRGPSMKARREDLFHLGHIDYLIRQMAEIHPERKKDFNRLKKLIKKLAHLAMPVQQIRGLVVQRLSSLLEQFANLASMRLRASHYSEEFAYLFEAGSEFKGELSYQETFMMSHAHQAPRSATEWEWVHQRSIAQSDFIDAEISIARKNWLNTLELAKQIPTSKRDSWLEAQRAEHFNQYPSLKTIQKLIDQKENADVSSLTELMRVLPYAAYNLRQFAIEQGVGFEELFTDKLVAQRVAILNHDELLKEKLAVGQFSGECFARKRKAHGLISESDVYLWVAKEQSPLVQLYTIGHELIHAAQIREVIECETQSRKAGGLAFARFLNHYGNFLSMASNTFDAQQGELAKTRRPLYGLPDRIVSQFTTSVIQDVRSGLAKGKTSYDVQLNKYGSLFGYMMPVGNSVKVRALREVIPALENAKNIVFAKECGLKISIDEVKAALPTANRIQMERYRKLITQAARNWQFDWEALRVIASHQYYGVMFPRAKEPENNLTIHTQPAPIFLNTAYNQTQQQQ